MDFIWGSGAGFRRDVPTHSEQDLRAGAWCDWRLGFRAESHRGPEGELRFDLPEDLPEGLQSGVCGDFDGALRIHAEGRFARR